jgi:hypothetical protein
MEPQILLNFQIITPRHPILSWLNPLHNNSVGTYLHRHRKLHIPRVPGRPGDRISKCSATFLSKINAYWFSLYQKYVTVNAHRVESAIEQLGS